MALSAIGGWMASAGVAKLVDQMCCFAGDQYVYQRDDAKEKLRRLEESLWKIKAMLQIANSCLQTRNLNMENWLGCIEDAVYDAEDVLDLFDFRVLEATVEHMTNSWCSTSGSSSSATSAATSSTNSTTVSRSARFCKRFFFSDEDLNELIAIVDRLDKISSKMQTLLMLVKPLEDRRLEQSTTQRRRTTTSMLEITKFYGRIGEEYKLKKLIVPTQDESRSYSVISVVGLAGVGKTALLQKVYSYFCDTGHFDFMAWIHVSENFDVKRITKEMIQAQECQKLKGRSNDRDRISWLGSVSADWNNISLDQVQTILQEKLHGKTILVILDDIWNEKWSQWENLCKPLQFSSKGSKVVLTTRSQKVAKINGATEIIPLDGLKDEDYWEHFKKCAFGDVAPTQQLRDIGQQVANKLAGSPLAAKTVGGKLKLNLQEDHWSAILGSKLWLIDQGEEDIIPALMLSYEHLPDKLKQCFVYFALFPKKYPLRGDVLIQMWRAQGYIEKETDETAHAYIEDLLQLSFIRKAAYQEDHYVVHDLLHDIAESVSKGKHFRIEDDFDVSIPDNVQHLYVNARNILKVFMSLAERNVKKGLRSLIISPGEGIHPVNFNKALEGTLNLHQLRSLRVLVLWHPDGILPDKIEHLVHLRYLDIRGSSMFTEVPKSLFKLYHLQALSLQFCYKDNKIKVGLQQGISRLTQLRYLTAPSKIISGIAQIGRLRHLQALEEYHVLRDSGHTICQLKELNELRGKLTIKNLENVRCQKESSEARLIKKLNLKNMSLCWNQLQEVNTSNTEYEGVFEGLQPNHNLRELHATGYMGTTSPTWLNRKYLQNIQTIELASCHYWKALPPFGSLPFLRILKMRHFKAMERIDAGFYGDASIVFPSLEEILFENMEQWKEWSGVESNRCMFSRPCSIFIKNCRHFKGPLPLPVSPKGINISVTDWLSANVTSTNSLKESNDLNKSFKLFLDHYGLLFGYLPSNSLATICVLDFSSRRLVSFNNEQEEWLRKLTSLKELHFTDCAKLTTLPMNLVHFTTLQSLYIEKCPKLKSFPEMGLPVSLKQLSVIRCHNNLANLCSHINICDIIIVSRDSKRESNLQSAKKRKLLSL